MSNITAGKRLYSINSTVEIIVVKAANVVLECAGSSMVDVKPLESSSTSIGEIIQLSKRYFDAQSGVLVLCTKSGIGPLTIEGRKLEIQAAQPLPSSD
jgi:hypothetical protein